MRSWKQGFRKLPAATRSRVDALAGPLLQVAAGKRLAALEIANGDYTHLGISDVSMQPPMHWEATPPAEVGPTSKKNANGWEVVRKDLPKYKKYFYQDIQNFGDGARNGWSTVAIPRDVYHHDAFPPFLFQIDIEVRERFADGSIGVVFKIDQAFDKRSSTFDGDILFAVNLLQENCGVHGVAEADATIPVLTETLSWELFPPGNIEDVVKAFSGREPGQGPDAEEVRERLRLFEEFEPKAFLRGLGGNDYYIGAKFADDLVVFENLKFGNALYVLYEDWEALSIKPRSELLKMPTSQFDRIVHTAGWQTRFAVLMQRQLQERGIRVRIGRHRQNRR
jgi:hypothetical protein